MHATERRYHKRQLDALQSKLADLSESLQLAIEELAQDDYDGTQDSRARLAEARGAVARAEAGVSDALNQMPSLLQPAESA